ncbi:carbon-nitrogen hydrolase family protein [Nocardioides sp. NPDC023903]|uniref:carbon-nitrogen hydrolase family protein n=1 Tax=Nocardioides sp. NPDC023903 TaxID=3157195 RepID=UPI0033F00E19
MTQKLTSDLVVAAVQMNSGPDVRANVAKAVDLINVAATEHHADLVVLPEFFNTEYIFTRHDPSLVRLAEHEDGPSMQAVKDAARRHGITIVATLLEEDGPGLTYDTAMVVAPSGSIVSKYRKTHPAATASLEKVFFRNGSYFNTTAVGGFSMGINICYDNEFSESARCSALNGADLIVAPFATPEQFPMTTIMSARACDNQLYVLAANKVGLEDELEFCGTSLVADPEGRLMAVASKTEEEIISSVINRRNVIDTRLSRPIYRDRRPDLYGALTTASEDLPRWRTAK